MPLPVQIPTKARRAGLSMACRDRRISPRIKLMKCFLIVENPARVGSGLILLEEDLPSADARDRESFSERTRIGTRGSLWILVWR